MVLPLSKNLVRYKSGNNFILDHNYQNNYIRCSIMMSHVTKKVLAIQKPVWASYNYFDGPTKLFSDL